MSTNKLDEDPGKPSLPVQNECINCHHKSPNETQFHCWICWPNHHLVCPKCQETGISCPIYKMSLLKNKGGEDSDQNPAGYSGGSEEVGEVNRDSKDDFIESDEKEMVIKVKTGQTIKIINDADNSTVTLTKNPGTEFSIISTSISGNNNNVTSQVSQVGPYNGLNNFNSSVSKGAIQVGAPVVGNSSTAAIKTAHTVPVLPMGHMGTGIVGSGSLGPGARVRMYNSTFTATGAIIYGDNNTINGNDNVIQGSNNKIFGDNNEVKGTNNQIHGNGNVKSGIKHNATQFECNTCTLLQLIILVLIYIILK